MFFYVFFVILVTQRMVELIIANRNEKWMKEKGATEYGTSHYRLMVGIHSAFFLTLLLEAGLFGERLNEYWPWLIAAFVLTQMGRVWVITSLGRFWNTKIIVLRDANVIAKGPYKYIKHPNYLIVTSELIIIPLIFNAYWTLFLFAILNQFILAIRIPLEEKALMNETDYQKVNLSKQNFIPLQKKEKS